MWPGDAVNAKAFDYYRCLDEVRKYVEKNYSQSISLTDAANIAGMEAKHFGKFF